MESHEHPELAVADDSQQNDTTSAGESEQDAQVVDGQTQDEATHDEGYTATDNVTGPQDNHEWVPYQSDNAVDQEGHARRWIQQVDEQTQRIYYYDLISGESQWEEPDGFISDVAQVAVQSRPPSAAAASAETTGQEAIHHQWKEYFDPRSKQSYFHDSMTGEIRWERPDEASLTWSDPIGDSAATIQRAFRRKTAANAAKERRELLQRLADPAMLDQKLKDLKRAVDEIDNELEARNQTISSSRKFDQLESLVASWELDAASIRDRVLDHHHQCQLLLAMPVSAVKITKAQQFHDALATTRANCLSLLRSICVHDASFLEVDTSRVNTAFRQYNQLRDCDMCTLTDSRVLRVIQGEEIRQCLDQSETALRRAMGQSDFVAGSTSSNGKTYREWRQHASAAVESVRLLALCVTQKRKLFVLYEQSLKEKNEAAMMSEEDARSRSRELAWRREMKEHRARMAYIERCRDSWNAGLEMLAQDKRSAEADDRRRVEERRYEKERFEKQRVMDCAKRKQLKLSIWEAVKEGYSVAVIRTMIYAEMRKARKNGFDFEVRVARSDRGESLLQIACWWGHEDLVSFLLDEGADLFAVDSYYNRFSLLHDAARRGHAAIVSSLTGRCGCPEEALIWRSDRSVYS
ncbi:hypothetical protein PINS_up014697 [Pythium insidiosum]|nr:hypothetical protein PINS_up014697 [Pythium insidiosum]